MASVLEEAAAMKQRLRDATNLSKKLQGEAAALDQGLVRQLRAAPKTDFAHGSTGSSARRETIACIDGILTSLNGLSAAKLTGTQRQQARRWKRLQLGGSSCPRSDVKPHALARSYPAAPPPVPAVHAGAVATQARFNRLHAQAEAQALRRDALQASHAKAEAEQAAAALASSRSSNAGTVAAHSGGRSGLEARVGRRAQREQLAAASVDAACAAIMQQQSFDPVALAQERRRKEWQRERRRAAHAAAAAAATTAAEIVSGAGAASPTTAAAAADLATGRDSAGRHRLESEAAGATSEAGDHSSARRPSSRMLGSADAYDADYAAWEDGENGQTVRESDWGGEGDWEGAGYWDGGDDVGSGSDENSASEATVGVLAGGTVAFDYASALDAVDQITLQFGGQAFAFPDDDLNAPQGTSPPLHGSTHYNSGRGGFLALGAASSGAAPEISAFSPGGYGESLNGCGPTSSGATPNILLDSLEELMGD
jgi:hypothetical protein